MIGNPNTTRRMQLAIDQKAASNREARAALYIVMRRPAPENLVMISPKEFKASKRLKAS